MIMKKKSTSPQLGDGTKNQPITIEALYPNLTAEEQVEAEYYLSRYLAVIKGIFEPNQNLTK